MNKKSPFLLVAVAGLALGLSCLGADEPPSGTAEATLEQAARANAIYKPLVHQTILEAAAANDVYDIDNHLLRGVDINTKRWDGSTALHLAVEAGHIYTIEHLLARGADINAARLQKRPRVPTPIVIAAEAGRYDITALLRKKGATYSLDTAAACGDIAAVKEFLEQNPKLLRQKSPNQWPPLFHAVQNNQMEMAKFLLDLGAPITDTDGSGYNLLYYAAVFNYEDMVKFLVAEGLFPNARLTHGDTVIHKLAANGKPISMIEMLVELGASVNLKNFTGLTPLHLAVQNRRKAVTKLLLSYRAQPNARDKKNRTPLYIAAQEGFLDLVALLIENHAVTGIKTKEGRTALHAAAATGQKHVVEFLLDKGAKLMERDWKNWTPLHLAAQGGHLEVVKLLMSKGAEVQVLAKPWTTALHAAAAAGQEAVVDYLLAQGAEVDLKDQAHQTPLFCALANEHLPVAELLLASGADANAVTKQGQTPLFPAVRAPEDVILAPPKDPNLTVPDGSRLAVLVLDHDAEVNVKDNTGLTPLHAAAKDGCFTTLEILLERGAEVNVKSEDGVTPLYLAAHREDPRMFELLVAHGADIHAREDNGVTVLHAAASQGRVDTAELLLNKGLKVDVTSEEGITPLHVAAENGQPHVAQVLIKRGADIHAKTKHGRTPLDLAEKSLERMMAKADSRYKLRLALPFDEMAVMLRALVSHSVVKAAMAGDLNRVRELLDTYPPYVNAEREYLPPLKRAVLAKNKPLVELLLTRGADPTIKCIEAGLGRKTAYELAAEKGFTEIATLLKRYEDAIVQAFQLDQERQMRGELDQKIDLYSQEYRLERRMGVGRQLLGREVQPTGEGDAQPGPQTPTTSKEE